VKWDEAFALAHRIRALMPAEVDRLPRLVGMPNGHWLVVHSNRSFASTAEWEQAIEQD
jgi:hypothetical protein